MKVLSFDNYISEKKSIKPLTIKQIKGLNIDLNDNLIKPGDNLEEGDMVLVACEKIHGAPRIDIRYGVYKAYYAASYIHYADNTSLPFNSIKQDYEYTYNDAYTHYILKVYRPIDEIHRIEPLKNKELFIEKVESSPFYKCIYKNEELCDKFGV